MRMNNWNISYICAFFVAVHVYVQPYQKGKIGITILTHWFEPKFKTAASRQAASRARDFFFGWWVVCLRESLGIGKKWNEMINNYSMYYWSSTT